MPQYYNHGGNCCGMKHIWGLGVEDLVTKRTFIKEKLERNLNGVGNNGIFYSNTACFLTEIVLTDEQMGSMPKLLQSMKELGFRRVSRFLNPNSGNVCNVFHSHKEPIVKAVEY